MAVMFIDGFDVFVLGKIAPLIAAHFQVPPAELSSLIVLQQLGLAIGAFAATPLADKYGRQRLLAIATAGFAVFSLLIPLAPDLMMLGMLRAVSGVFLSGALPMVIALLAETIPRAKRATCISLALGAYSGGSAAGGIVAAWVVGTAGWQSAFVIGGLLPLGLLPLILWRLPESPHFLAARSADPVRHRKAALLLDPSARAEEGFRFEAGTRDAGRQVGTLLRRLTEGRRRLTGVMWAITFLSMGCIALLGSWLPSFFHQWRGVPVQEFAKFALVAFAGGLAGTLGSGWLMDRFQAILLLRVAFAGLAISLLLIGQLPFGMGAFLVALTAWNLFQSGGQALVNTFLSRAYPVGVRSMGIGWAGGAGRVGGIVLPSMGGVMLAGDIGLPQAMALVAIAPSLVFVLTFLLPKDAKVDTA